MPSSTPEPPTPGGDSSEPAAPPDLLPSPGVWPGLDRLGTTQAIGGLALALIALYGLRPATPTPPMTTSRSPAITSSCSSNGGSFASLPRWRQFLSMLNWHRDPDYEMRINALRSETEQLRRENKRLAEIESRLDALLRSPDSSCSTTPDIDGN